MSELIIRGGRIIDPAQAIDRIGDVVIRDGRIAQTGVATLASSAAEIIDARGKLVIPGMIDTHAHVFEHVTGSFGLEPETVGVRSGVTTLVDQGGPSCINIGAFRKWIVAPSATRVLAYLSCYLVGGLEGHLYPELHGPEQINVDATVRAANDNRDLVRGIKAHAEIGGASRWGLRALELACRIGREADLPVYVHLGQLWPTKDRAIVDADALVRDVVPLLRPGDVLAHPFTRHPGGFIDNTGRLHPVIREALARGLRVDVGHGSHFSFEMARHALDAGILPYTLGADLHGLNVRIPDTKPGESQAAHPFFGAAPFSLAIAMTELVALGVPLVEVVRMVTQNPAELLGMGDTIGSLRPGTVADVSVLDCKSGRFVLRDNKRVEVVAESLIEPAFCIRAGRRFDADSPILPRLEVAA